MPVVKIDMWEGRDKETKRKLIKSVAKAVSESLNIDINHTVVVITDVSKDNWGYNGDQASEI
jgi:4-oxalocrotonate tautomerase